MQVCKPIRAAWTLGRCFERSEIVRTVAKDLCLENVAFVE